MRRQKQKPKLGKPEIPRYTTDLLFGQSQTWIQSLIEGPSQGNKDPSHRAPHRAIVFHCLSLLGDIGQLVTRLIANFGWLPCLQVLENQCENPDEGERHHPV